MGNTKLQHLRMVYKKGDRLEVVNMLDSVIVPKGTKGTVEYVDDECNVHVKWDNGSHLPFIPDFDKIIRLGKMS